VLQVLASRLGLRLGVASIDDFYLPWQERLEALAGNPFGVSRVPPGSHDIGLLEESLRHWRGGGPWERPRFDKSLRGGQGDRTGVEQVSCEAVVVEGWLMGCRPLGLAAEAETQRQATGLSPAELAWLPHWDRQLARYQGAWSEFGELWVLRPTDWSLPRRWRFQAEARQRRAVMAAQGQDRQDGGEGQSAASGGGSWLDPRALDALVRSSLASLPPPLYQDPLLEQSLPVPTRAVAWLDSRRRCVACRAPLVRVDQASPASSSSLMG
jgi:D-glycerate 3-kinase